MDEVMTCQKSDSKQADDSQLKDILMKLQFFGIIIQLDYDQF